jgi:hypothetical protein
MSRTCRHILEAAHLRWRRSIDERTPARSVRAAMTILAKL